jgi:hypothetical protein
MCHDLTCVTALHAPSRTQSAEFFLEFDERGTPKASDSLRALYRYLSATPKHSWSITVRLALARQPDPVRLTPQSSSPSTSSPPPPQLPTTSEVHFIEELVRMLLATRLRDAHHDTDARVRSDLISPFIQHFPSIKPRLIHHTISLLPGTRKLQATERACSSSSVAGRPSSSSDTKRRSSPPPPPCSPRTAPADWSKIKRETCFLLWRRENGEFLFRPWRRRSERSTRSAADSS